MVELKNPSYESALALYHDGHISDALLEAESLLDRNQDALDLLKLAGACCFQMERKGDAMSFWERALSQRPDDAAMLANLGLVLHDLGRPRDAEVVLRRSLAVDPTGVATLNNLGRLMMDCGRFDEAEAHFRQALANAPEFIDAIRNLGLALHALGRLVEAEAVFCRALAIAPEQVAATNDLGRVLRDLGRLADAKHVFAHATRIAPDFVEAYTNLGMVLRESGDLENSEAAYRHALALDPLSGEIAGELGVVVYERGKLEQAISHLKCALTLTPHSPKAHCNLAYALLTAGRYLEAWPHLEERLNRPDADRPTASYEALPLVRWQEGEPPGAGRIVVLHEEGLGDALQFCRYLPLLLSRCTQVGYVCPTPLRRLFAEALCSRWPNLMLLDHVPHESTGWDGYCSLLSLPKLFGTQLDTIPAPIPYLHAEPHRARAWSERLAALGSTRPRIGIVWAGGNSGTIADARRSIDPNVFAQLFSWTGAHWISLQKTEDHAKRLPLHGRPQVIDWTDEITDFADTAALVNGLDLVITVDTSTAHLAAAMGKPVWVLNRFAGCWRWLREREDSPWYPGLRLFTQVESGDWNEVLKRVSRELEAWSATR